MIDDIEAPASARSAMPDWQRNLLIGLCGLACVFAIGFGTGALVTALEDGFAPANTALVAGSALVAIGAGWSGWRIHASHAAEPVAASVRASRKTLLIGSLMGLVTGLAFAVSTDLYGSEGLFSNTAIPAMVAAITILAWVFGGSLLTVKWLASIDEHEKMANNAGAVSALYTYLLIEPSWWLGWRGGFLPEPQPMMTFLAVIVVYSAVWFWRRSR